MKKFCKDCQFYLEGPSLDEYYRVNGSFCDLPKNKDPVSGKPTVRCRHERAGSWFWNILDGDCGPQARFFKEKDDV